MRAGPLVMRELREQSRRAVTYWLRTLGFLFVCVVTVYLALHTPGRTPGALGPGSWSGTVGSVAEGRGLLGAVVEFFEKPGNAIFSTMNHFLMAAVLVVGPLSCADALSRERREGTLGLLFLTPLRATDVVFAKWVAHGLRAGAVLLGAVPVLVIPMLMGGVAVSDVVRAILMDVGALVLALTAGLLASTWWQGPRAVVFGALAVSIVSAMAWLLGWTATEALVRQVSAGAEDPLGSVAKAIHSRFLGIYWQVSAMASNPSWYWMSRASGGRRGAGLVAAAGLLTFAFVVAGVVFRLTVASVLRHQVVGRPPGLGDRVADWLGRPMLLAQGLSRIKRWVVDHQPMLWTEFRTWRLRVGVWVMLLITLIAVVFWEAQLWGGGWPTTHGAPLLMMTGLLGMAAASCLQTERRSGVLELMLTVPGGERRVLMGKVWALSLQVAPSALLLVLVVMFLAAVRSTGPAGWGAVVSLAGGIVGPVVARLALAIATGLFFSLRLRAALVAYLATAFVLGIQEILRLGLLQALGRGAMDYRMLVLFGRWEGSRQPELVAMVFDALLALVLFVLLYRSLQRRSFATE